MVVYKIHKEIGLHYARMYVYVHLRKIINWTPLLTAMTYVIFDAVGNFSTTISIESLTPIALDRKTGFCSFGSKLFLFVLHLYSPITGSRSVVWCVDVMTLLVEER